MERHDNDSAIRVAEFDVAATLAGLFKPHLAKNRMASVPETTGSAGLTQKDAMSQ